MLLSNLLHYLYRTSSALRVYRETVAAGINPTIDVLSQVLGCLQLPFDASLKNRLIENLGVSADTSRPSNLCSLIDGFGEYDPRAFSLLEVCRAEFFSDLFGSYFGIDANWKPCNIIL